MNDYKHIQLELPLFFKTDQQESNVISFPHKNVLEKLKKKKADERQEAIMKGIEKCIKSLTWY